MSFESTRPRWSARFKLGTLLALLLPLACVSADKLVDPQPPETPSAEVVLLVITPSYVTVQTGQTVDFTVVGLTATGDTAPVAVTWLASRGTVTEAGDSKPGQRKGHYKSPGQPGRDTVISGDDGGNADTAIVDVTDTAVATVTVSPSTAQVEAGATLQLTAQVRDASGNTLSGRSVSWSTNASSIVTVSNNGVVTGVAAGVATITATVEGKQGTAAITVTDPPPPPPGSEFVLVGAGDIAACGSNGDEATAALLDDIPGTVFTAGDNAYPDGTTADFNDCYHPSWGRHKSRTRPSPGNHDYHTQGAAPYYAYFGANAGPSGLGYYSYDLGDWHVIALNSEISMSAGSTQETWLRSDLAATTKQCVVAYMHRPRFSSSSNHGSSTGPRALWQALYDAGAEIVIAGHDHTYERFAPQTPDGVADPARGIRQFVAGTGGKGLYSFGTPVANSEVRYNSTYGVLKLTLRSGGYSWEFVPTSGSFRDSGSTSCHGPPGSASSLTLSGAQEPFHDRDLPPGTTVDARTATWTGDYFAPIVVGTSELTWLGGTVRGTFADTASWETMHDAYSMVITNSPNFLLEGFRTHNYGDGPRIDDGLSDGFTVRVAHASVMRDDCFENDFVVAGLIEDSFFDGCFVGYSSEPWTTVPDNSHKVVTIRNSLWRLMPMPTVYRGDAPGHGRFWKMDDVGRDPRIALHDNVFMLEQAPTCCGDYLILPDERLASCSGNTMVWLGQGPWPGEPIPACFTFTTDRTVWDEAVADWLARHPENAQRFTFP